MRHGYTFLAAAGLSMGGAIAQDSHICCNNQSIKAILIEKGVITPEELIPTPEPLPPTADFSITPTTGDAPLTVAFKDRSIGAVSSRSWRFGDGAESSEQNPSHTYAAQGIYTVVLTVDGPGGSDTATRLDTINVTNPLTPPPPPYVRTSLPERKYVRGGLGSADQEWSSRGPYWSGSGDTVFVEGATDMTESLYAFAEYEEFSSSDQFVQEAMIAGAGWDTRLNDDADAGLKLGFAHLSSRYWDMGGFQRGTQIDSLFVGGGVRYLLGEQLMGELELWKGPKMDAFSARIEWLLEQRYGLFLQSLTRGDYSGLRFGLSLFF